MFSDPLTAKLAAFVRGVGIEVHAVTLPDPTFLAGLDIRCGAILVDESRLQYPGDLLHGDRNGVALVSNEIASAVAQACPELVEAELVILGYLRSGKVTPAGFAAARKESQRRIEALGRKLRGEPAA